MVQKTIDQQNPTETSSKNTTLGAISHVLALFGWLIGPVIIYFVADDEFAKRNAANAINWQISFTLLMVLSGVLSIVVIGIIGFIVFPILDLAFCVVAAVKASDGELWNYPATIDFV